MIGRIGKASGTPCDAPLVRRHEVIQSAADSPTSSWINSVRAVDDQAISAAVCRGEPQPLPSAVHGGLPEIPAWQGSLEDCVSRSQAGLKLAMSQLGIRADTAFTVDADTFDGHVRVLGEFEGREALEAVINTNRDLRDALKMSSGNASFQRVVAIAQAGAQAARSDAAHADAYSAWIVEASREAQSLPVFLRFAGGVLSARVLTAHGPVAPLESLPRLP